jgi:hypothetical protein
MIIVPLISICLDHFFLIGKILLKHPPIEEVLEEAETKYKGKEKQN